MQIENPFAQSNTYYIKSFNDVKTNDCKPVENKLRSSIMFELPKQMPSFNRKTLSQKCRENMAKAEKNMKKEEINLSELRKELKYKFLEWCSYSTAHGIPNMSRTNSKVIFFIWLIAFLASTAYCCNTIIAVIVQYIKYGVLINMQVVDKAPIEFPAVTVCNLNPLNRNFSQYYIDRVLAKHNMTSVNNYRTMSISPDTVKYLIKSNIAADSNLTITEKRKFGFEIDYMLLTCYFNDKPCYPSDFVWHYDFAYGSCYTFNSGFDQQGNPVEIKKMNEAGSDRSFKLELFLGDEWSQGIYMVQSGARVVVHNQSVTPLIDVEGQDLSTNYQTDIGITRTFLSKLEYPYSNCVKDTQSVSGFSSAYYKAMFSVLNITTYRQKNCVKLCLQDYIRKMCKCIDAGLPNIYGNTVLICSSMRQLDCIQNARISYSSDKEANSCEECPLECDSVEYVLSLSRSRYPTIYYTNYLRYQTNLVSRFPSNVIVSDNHIQKNIVLMNVFYDDLATLYVKEIPEIKADELFGTIGGNEKFQKELNPIEMLFYFFLQRKSWFVCGYVNSKLCGNHRIDYRMPTHLLKAP
jgi:hypothetical protein